MKNLIRVSSLVIVLITLFNFNTFAQKKQKDIETQINTATPTFSVVWQAKDTDGNDLGMLEIQIVDRKSQLVSVKMQRLLDQINTKEPITPKLKLIHLPEIDSRTYKIAESMDELQMPVDNNKVLLIDYLVLIEAMRTKYN